MSPFDLQHHLILAQSLYYSARYDEAFEELRTTLLQNPNAWLGRGALSWVYEQKGDLSRSIAELKRAVDVEHSIAEPLAALGRAYALQGDRRAANDILKQLTERAGHTHVSRYALAVIHEGLGEDEQAIRELRTAYEEHSWSIDFLGVDPKMERIRSDPRVPRDSPPSRPSIGQRGDSLSVSGGLRTGCTAYSGGHPRRFFELRLNSVKKFARAQIENHVVSIARTSRTKTLKSLFAI